ncbi:MAG: hypothetical protein V4686_03975 [Patescibacteria group bacterium]
MLKKHKNIIIGITAVILIFFGYWYLVLSKKGDSKAQSNSLVASNNTQTSQSPVSAYDKEFVANLQTVRYIDLNTEIFNKPAYKALSFPEVPFAVDYNIPVGRRNPFLPIGLDSQTTPATVVAPAATTTPATTPTPTAQPKAR